MKNLQQDISEKAEALKAGIKNLGSNPAYFILLAVFILTTAYNYHWVKADITPPAWDQANHMISALGYYYELTNPSAQMVSNILSVDNYYPPFYAFSTAIFYLFFGTSPDASIMANSIYLAVLLLSVYGIGTRLFDKRTGVLAAVFVSLFPAVSNLQRDFLIDFSLIAIVSLTVYFLIASDYFKNETYSQLFGFSLAIAMLVKWTAFIFVAGPLGYVIFKAFASRVNSGVYKKQVSNFGYSVALAVLISGIWYVQNIPIFNLIFGQQSVGAFEGDPEIFTAHSFLYYPLAGVKYMSFIFLLLFVSGLFILFKKRPDYALLLYLYIILPYFIFTLVRNKDERYLVPVVVPVAIIAAVSVSSIKNKNIFAIIVILVSLFGIIQLFPQEAGSRSIETGTPYGPLYLFGPGIRPPSTQDWKASEVMQDLIQDAGSNPRIVKKGSVGAVGVIPDMPYLNGATYQYYSYLNMSSLDVFNCVYMQPSTYRLYFFNFDYMVVRDAKNVNSPYNVLSDGIREYFYITKGDNYILFKQYVLPDRSNLSVYKNIMAFT